MTFEEIEFAGSLVLLEQKDLQEPESAGSLVLLNSELLLSMPTLAFKLWCATLDTRQRPSFRRPLPLPLKSSFPSQILSLNIGVPHLTLDSTLPCEDLSLFF